MAEISPFEFSKMAACRYLGFFDFIETGIAPFDPPTQKTPR